MYFYRLPSKFSCWYTIIKVHCQAALDDATFVHSTNKKIEGASKANKRWFDTSEIAEFIDQFSWILSYSVSMFLKVNELWYIFGHIESAWIYIILYISRIKSLTKEDSVWYEIGSKKVSASKVSWCCQDRLSIINTHLHIVLGDNNLASIRKIYQEGQGKRVEIVNCDLFLLLFHQII